MVVVRQNDFMMFWGFVNRWMDRQTDIGGFRVTFATENDKTVGKTSVKTIDKTFGETIEIQELILGLLNFKKTRYSGQIKCPYRVIVYI